MRARVLTRAIGLLAWMACTLAPIAAIAATFTATLDRTTIQLGERATLSLTFEGGTPRQVPAPPAVPGLQIAYAGPSSSVSIINGDVTSIMSYVFTVAPERLGEFTIPELAADVGGQRLTTQPLKLTVQRAGSVVPSTAGDPLVLFRLRMPRDEVFIGEVITAELLIYLHSAIQNFGRFQLVSFPANGFTVGKMAEGTRRREQIGNALYNVIPIRVAITPTRAGQFTLGPVTASLVIEVPSPNRRRDRFDPLSFFTPTEQREVTLATDPTTIHARPLPVENVPPGFGGVVGQYSVELQAGPTNVAVGDPITLRIQFTGQGALEALSLPELGWPNFKTYPPTSKIDSTDPLGITGTRIFEQIVVPQRDDISALPEFAFTFFDPESKEYKTARLPPIPVIVRPAGSTPLPSIAAAGNETPEASREIVTIKQRLGTVAQASPPLFRQSWFLAMQAAPLVVFAGALLIQRRRESLAHNPRLRRERRVARAIRAGLEELRQAASQNNSDQFFAVVFRLLQERLGERLDMPASAITEAVVDERLRPRGVSPQLLDAAQRLFHMCNLARYAPVKSSQELTALIPDVEGTLRELETLDA